MLRLEWSAHLTCTLSYLMPTKPYQQGYKAMPFH